MISPAMTISPSKDLFRQATTSEKLALFQSLLESQDMQPGEALAVLGAIHAELRRPLADQRGSMYARYAQLMQSLLHRMPNIHQHVVANWQLH